MTTARIASSSKDTGLAPLPLLTRSDAKSLAILSAGWLTSALLPARFDAWTARIVARTWLRAHPAAPKLLAEKMKNRLGAAAGPRDLDEIARQHYLMRFETGWGRIRGMHRAGWSPEVSIEGLQRVQQGLSAGRGVILWRMAFCSGPAVMHACMRAGLPLVHLSRAGHGSTQPSRLGLRTVCRLWQRAENRRLEERVVIPLDGSLEYVQILLDRLAANRVLSIVGEHAGRGNVTARLLGVEKQFATGAPALAWEVGSTLLTLCAVREAPCRYRVVIDPPIHLDRGLGRSTAIRMAVEEYVHRLERRIVEYPAGWRGWGTRLI
jgi:lauroyl/myristoyl acyltransferase